jgi:hypothetical protein
MGRKKDEMTDVLADYKYVRLQLSPEMHKAFRIEAAKRETNMSALARVAVEEFMARIEKGSHRN